MFRLLGENFDISGLGDVPGAGNPHGEA